MNYKLYIEGERDGALNEVCANYLYIVYILYYEWQIAGIFYFYKI